MTTMNSTRPPPVRQKSPRTFTPSRGVTRTNHKIVLYGTGGIGKSSLLAAADGVLIADLEGGTKDLDIARIDAIETWEDLRGFAQSEMPEGTKTVGFDSGTKAEELCSRYVIANVKTEKGQSVNRIEDYGYGKGYSHIFGEWINFLSDLDQLYRKGFNVVLVCHEQVSLIPNPSGEDFKRYQPRLQSSEKANVMAATKEWADHVFFVSYDAVVREGKAKGEGSRTIYCTETPSRLAKTRTLSGEPIVFDKGSRAIWDALAGTNTNEQPPL